MWFEHHGGKTSAIILVCCLLAAILSVIQFFDAHILLAGLVLIPAFAAFGLAKPREGSDGSPSQEVQTLVRLTASQHPSTLDHGRRVAGPAQEIARRLGLEEFHSHLIATAALLHDVGKAAIDFAILDKPGPLTDAEYLEVQKHSLIGAQMLAATRHLRKLSPWIKSHHERIDGTGYPAGLRGNRVPLESRIIAVVDAYDAMVGGGDGARCYQTPRNPSEAIIELRRCAGTQFDPAIVEVFCGMLLADGAVLSSVGD